MDYCKGCGAPMAIGLEAVYLERKDGREWWHKECADDAFRPFSVEGLSAPQALSKLQAEIGEAT